MPIKPDRPDIIFNLGCALTNTLTGNSFDNLGKMLRESGLNGVSIHPYRVNREISRLKTEFPSVVLVEDAWNPGNFEFLPFALIEGGSGFIRRKLGDFSQPPLPQDTIGFPNKVNSFKLTDKLMSSFPYALFGSDKFDSERYPGRTFFHIQSEASHHSLTPDQVVDLSLKYSTPLLFDPSRLFEGGSINFPEGPTRIPQDEALHQLLYFSQKTEIAGVDIRPSSKEDIDNLVLYKGLSWDLAQAARGIKANFIRIEIRLPNLPLLPFNIRTNSQNQAARKLGETVFALKMAVL